MLTFITNKTHDIEGIRTISDIAELIDFMNNNEELCIDTETNSLDTLTAELYLVSIGNEERQYVIDATSIPIDFLNNYSHMLWVGHNIKYDYCIFKMRGITLYNMYDTMIVEQRLGMGSGRRNALDVVIKRRLGIDLKMNKEETRGSFTSFKGIFNTNQIIYSGEDSEHLLKIKRIQKPLIEKFEMEFLIYGIELPLIKILADCELRGLVIDREKWIEIIKQKEQEERDLKKKLDEILKQSQYSSTLFTLFNKTIGKKSLGLWSQKLSVNYNSSSQIKRIFTTFGESIPTGTRKNKEGEFEATETVGVKNIQLYLKQKPESSLKEFLEVFIKYKKVQKHLSSFGYNYLDMISTKTGRLHTIYKQCFTETGRLSCGDTAGAGKPNLQQIPKLKKLRQCFGYLPGYKILTIDLTGAELVILGSKAQDFKLIELNEGDMHSYLATKAWQKILNDETYVISQEQNKDKRTEFKNVNYGILYGAGVRKIAETLNISLEQAEKVDAVLRSEIPRTFDYMDTVSKQAVEDGFIVFNKRTNSRRWFVDRSRKNLGRIKRAAINSPIQGSQADMIKEAMVELHKQLPELLTDDAQFLMQVHDELVFAFKDDAFPEKVKSVLLDTSNKYLEGVKMKAGYIVENTWDKD